MKEISRRVFDKHLEKINKKEKAIEDKRLKKLYEHKCYRCVFSTWTGIKLFCMLPRCIRGR